MSDTHYCKQSDMISKEESSVSIYNTEINDMANLSGRDFLKKVSPVKMIRTGDALSFTFYPTDKDEIQRNRLIWEYINGNLNALNSERRYFFHVEFPQWVYLFLKYSTWENVEKSIVVALTGLYVADPRGRQFLEDQLDKDTLKSIQSLFYKNFKEFENFVFIQAEDLELMDEINSDYWDKQKLFVSKFDYFFRDNSGNPIILPYIYPVHDYRFQRKSMFVRTKFDVGFLCSYFNDSDWNSIIINEREDSLQRSESTEEPWKRWRQKFMDRHKIEE